jgi:hypothetical protein
VRLNTGLSAVASSAASVFTLGCVRLNVRVACGRTLGCLRLLAWFPAVTSLAACGWTLTCAQFHVRLCAGSNTAPRCCTAGHVRLHACLLVVHGCSTLDNRAVARLVGCCGAFCWVRLHACLHFAARLFSCCGALKIVGLHNRLPAVERSASCCSTIICVGLKTRLPVVARLASCCKRLDSLRFHALLLAGARPAA